jgi:hypothetical protein
LVESQRTAVLVTLNRLGWQIKNLTDKLEFYQELAACEMWTALEAIKKATPRMGVKWEEQVMIDRKVHQMDPDFSFSGLMYNEPKPSLLARERPK